MSDEKAKINSQLLYQLSYRGMLLKTKVFYNNSE